MHTPPSRRRAPWRHSPGLTSFLAQLAALAGPTGMTAQVPAIPPVRPLGRIVAVTKDSLASIASIRPLSDGRVLVNDRAARRVVLFDSMLAHGVAVVDTTSETAKAYGANGGALFPFTGDSSLFADFTSLSFLVVDPGGKLGRVMAAPRGPAGGIAFLGASNYAPAVDSRGNVISRWTTAAAGRIGGAGGGGVGRGGGLVVGGGVGGAGSAPTPNATPVVTRDSTLILRINIETKKTDTVVWLAAPTRTTIQTLGPRGGLLTTLLRNPMPAADAWALMPDGTVAAIREHDYHIDWIAPDGSTTSSPKIQHEWAHVTDSAKAAILDSVKHADSLDMAKEQATVDSAIAAAKKRGAVVTTNPGGLISVADPNGETSYYGTPAPPQYVDPNDLPDYYPPFEASDSLGAGPARADAEGNVWVRVNSGKRFEGGPVYDVVNRQGKLIDRVQIPGGTVLIGFGPGVAYLMSREGKGLKLARARIR